MLKYSFIFICAITFTKDHSEATIGVNEELVPIPLDQNIGMSTQEYQEVGQFVWSNWNPLRFLFIRGQQPHEESICKKYDTSQLIEACKQMKLKNEDVDTFIETSKCASLKMYVKRLESTEYTLQNQIKINVYPCFENGKLRNGAKYYVGLGYKRLKEDENVLLKYGYSPLFGLVVVAKYAVRKISKLPDEPNVLNVPTNTNDEKGQKQRISKL